VAGDSVTVIEREAADAGVLIAAARARRRRRRGWLALLVVLAALAATGGYLASSAGGTGAGHPATAPPPRSGHQQTRPVVNPAALRGHGTVAFISRGALWLFGDGVVGLRELLPAAQRPNHPVFSADGRWLAVTTGRDGQYIWVARADGSDLHRLPWRFASVDGWRPSGHTLALDIAGRGDASSLTLLTPGRGTRVIARVHGEYGAVWSPGGQSLAVAATDQPKGRTTIRTYPATGGHATTWYSVDDRHGRLDGMNQLRLIPAGWWTKQGIGFWILGDGMTMATDQTPLFLLPAPGDTPRLLGSTLIGVTAPAVAGSRSGYLAIVAETRRQGFGRLIWQGKSVEVCRSPVTECTPVTAPHGTVTLDPTWSPDGHTLAYVQAPQRSSPGFPQHVIHRWYASHRLHTYNAVTGARKAVPHSAGASAPRWSSDGRDLLYVAGNGLWLLRPGAGPERIAAPFYPAHDWPAYYGQIDWIGQYAWSR
jgi:hypothetical protein